MTYGNGCSITAATGGDTVILRRKVGTFSLCCGPGGNDKSGSQRLVSLGGPAGFRATCGFPI